MEMGRSMLTSASPARSGGAGAGADPAKARYGFMTTDRKICSTYRGGACSRSRSAAAAAALNDHRNLAAFDTFAAVARAREARAGSSELRGRATCSSRLVGAAAAGDVVIFVLAKLLVGRFRFGADDGAQAVAADVGFAGPGRAGGDGAGADRAKARYGVIDNRSEIPQL